MSLSAVAALIAAIAFAVLVLALALPLFHLSRVFRRLTASVDQLTQRLDETIRETTKSLEESNRQIAKIDTITSAAAQVAEDVSAVSTLVSSTVAKPLIKLSAFSYATRKMLGKTQEPTPTDSKTELKSGVEN